jgi:hypothetical protein
MTAPGCWDCMSRRRRGLRHNLIRRHRQRLHLPGHGDQGTVRLHALRLNSRGDLGMIEDEIRAVDAA